MVSEIINAFSSYFLQLSYLFLPHYSDGLLLLTVIDLLMDLSRRTPRVLRRVILSLLDDMLWNRRSIVFLEEYRSGRRSNDAVSILLGFWAEEEDLRGIDTNSKDPIADTADSSLR